MKKSIVCLFLCLALLLPLSAISEAAEGELYPARFGDKWGYINRQGETIIEPQWMYADSFRGDYATVRVSLNEDMTSVSGIIDKSGAYVLEPIYSLDDGYDGGYYGGRETGLIWVTDDQNGTGFFNIPNGYFSGMIYGSYVHPWIGDGRLVTLCQNDLYGFIDRYTGEIVIPCSYFDEPTSFEEGFARLPLYVEDREEYHLINEKDQFYMPPKGTKLSGMEFSEGLIEICDEQTDLRGFADAEGKLVIPALYEETGSFSEGYAAVKQNGLWGLIAKDGSVVCEPKYDCERDFAFHNGAAVMTLTDGAAVAIDGTGKELFRMDDTWCSAFEKSGVAKFSPADSEPLDYGEPEIACFVTREGKVIVKPEDGYLYDGGYAEDYDGIFSEGYQALIKDGKCGFIDMEGNVAIDFTWSRADNFIDGLAMVYDQNNKMAYIDYTGTVVWSEP